MKGLGKKVVALATVAIMAATALTGCGKGIDNKATAIEVNGTKVTAGVANFYMRYRQKEMENMFAQMGQGSNIWNQDLGEGATYEQMLKEEAVETLIELYILKERAAEYKVELTKEEKEAIDTAANAFVKANKEDAREKISGDLEIIKEVMELITIGEKMKTTIKDELTVEISDEEALHKKMAYVQFPKVVNNADGTTTSLSEDEIAAAKKQAGDALEAAKVAGELASSDSMQVNEIAFNKESTTLDEAVIKAADALGEGEFSEVIETEDGFYVVQLKSLLDREATDQKKATLVQEKKEEYYTKTYEAWREKAKVKIHQKVIDKINFSALEIKSPAVG